MMILITYHYFLTCFINDPKKTNLKILLFLKLINLFLISGFKFMVRIIRTSKIFKTDFIILMPRLICRTLK